MNDEEIRVLRWLQEIADRGGHAMACDGSDRAPANALWKGGHAEWCGTNWGSSFYCITDRGREALASVDTHPEGEDPAQTGASFMSGAARSEAKGDAR